MLENLRNDEKILIGASLLGIGMLFFSKKTPTLNDAYWDNHEFGKTKLTDKIEDIKDTVYKIVSDKVLKSHYSIGRNHYDNQYGHHWGYNIRNTKTQKHVGDMKISIDDGDYTLTLAEVGYFTKDFSLEKGSNKKYKRESGDFASLKRPTKIKIIKEAVDEFLDIIRNK